MHEFKITYRDGATQTVTAAQHKIEGGWIVFYDGGGQVHSVPSADVQSISRSGVADRTEGFIGIA